jgi:mevalonate kinase
MNNRYYASKLLLFGEYAIIFNSMALATPFRKFRGTLSISKDKNQNQEHSNVILKEFAEYLIQHHISFLDLKKLSADLDKGLVFKSNIPHSYGLGSSGALCAAIYDNYRMDKNLNKDNLFSIRKELAMMESFFHGNSSGVDPLVSLMNRNILLLDKEKIDIIQIQWDKLFKSLLVFLIDTRQTGDTGPLVKWFVENADNQYEKKELKRHLIDYTNLSINAFINYSTDVFMEISHHLSTFQLKLMEPMIPDDHKHIWHQGLEKKLFNLKLCGSGGGGYILGFARASKKNQVKEELKNYYVQFLQ